MKKSDQTKKLVLEQLRKTPIVQVVCEKLEISRMTYYRWKQEDKEFAKATEEAIIDGMHLVNDLAESQLVGAIKDKNFAAIAYWLRHHHPSYANKLEIEHALKDETLSPEQEALVRRGLLFASGELEINISNQSQNEQEHNPTGIGGGDDQGQEGARGDN